jgi:hypothetical protein
LQDHRIQTDDIGATDVVELDAVRHSRKR